MTVLVDRVVGMAEISEVTSQSQSLLTLLGEKFIFNIKTINTIPWYRKSAFVNIKASTRDWKRLGIGSGWGIPISLSYVPFFFFKKKPLII